MFDKYEKKENRLRKVVGIFGYCTLFSFIAMLIPEIVPVPAMIINATVVSFICSIAFLCVVGAQLGFTYLPARNKAKDRIIQYAADNNISALPYTKDIAKYILDAEKMLSSLCLKNMAVIFLQLKQLSQTFTNMGHTMAF